MTDLLMSSAVDSSIRAIALGAAVALILTVFRIRSSRTRHAAWSAVALTMLLMPLLARVAPPVPIPAPIASAPTTIVRIDPPAMSTPATPGTIQSAPVEPAIAAPGVDTPRPVPGMLSWLPRMRLWLPPSGGSASIWSLAVSAVYLAGVVLLLTRMLAGLIQLSRIRRSSRPIATLTAAFESTLVATPVTIGLLSPRVVLPTAWRKWSSEALAAVLAHERAHVARRDPLIALAARLNCIVFWFHPLAWWLEGRIATLAEHACDDAALKQIAARSYAETLLDMAANVNRHRGRLVWEAVGVDGDGRIGRRIDRVLAGAASLEPSRVRRRLVGASCAAAIVAAIACQQQTAKVEPLREDPSLAAELKAQADRLAALRASAQTTSAEAAALETVLEQNPEDIEARRKLVNFYRWTGKNPQPWNDNVAARRRHLLWLVEHHPDSDLLAGLRLTQREDPQGYAETRTLWLAQTARADVTPQVLSNAAYFFAYSEKPLAEQMLLKAQALQPDGPQPRLRDSIYAPPWSARLGILYASAITGRTSDSTAGPDFSNQRWGRERLDAATDGHVLLAAGYRLTVTGPDDERRAYGEQLIERVSQMKGPAGEEARQMLRERAGQNPQREAFGRAPRSQWEAILARSTGVTRLRQLTVLAEHEYSSARWFAWTTTPKAATTQWGSQASTDAERDKRLTAEKFAQSKAYAKEAIDLASSLTDPEAREYAFLAHISYGLVVFQEGKRDEALRHLAESSRLPAPDGPAIGRWASGQESTLVFALLQHGERQTIVDYLERAAQRRDAGRRKTMLDMAAAIRDGRMPEQYQRLFASGER